MKNETVEKLKKSMVRDWIYMFLLAAIATIFIDNLKYFLICAVVILGLDMFIRYIEKIPMGFGKNTDIRFRILSGLSTGLFVFLYGISGLKLWAVYVFFIISGIILTLDYKNRIKKVRNKDLENKNIK